MPTSSNTVKQLSPFGLVCEKASRSPAHESPHHSEALKSRQRRQSSCRTFAVHKAQNFPLVCGNDRRNHPLRSVRRFNRNARSAVSFEPAANAAAEFSTANAQSTNASNCFKYLFSFFTSPFGCSSAARFRRNDSITGRECCQSEMSNE